MSLDALRDNAVKQRPEHDSMLRSFTLTDPAVVAPSPTTRCPVGIIFVILLFAKAALGFMQTVGAYEQPAGRTSA